MIRSPSFCWYIRAGRSGATRTPGPGRSRRVSTKRTRIPLAAARREFEEETGCHVDGDFIAIGSFRQPGGKIVTAFAVEGDFDVAALRSNTFTIEWPPRSGRQASFPEVDRAEWFSPAAARVKLLKGQVPILDAFLAQWRANPPQTSS